MILLSTDMQCQTRQYNYRGREYQKGEHGEHGLLLPKSGGLEDCSVNDSTNNLLISLDSHRTGPYQPPCQVCGGLKQFEPLNAFHGIHKQIQRCFFNAFLHWILVRPFVDVLNH